MARPRKNVYPEGTIGAEEHPVPDVVALEYPADDGDSADESAGENGRADTPRKRRGGGPGSRGGPGARARNKAAKGPLDISGIEKLLFSIHAMLAGWTGQPVWALDHAESDMLANGITAVARHYDLPDMPAQVVDWSNLLMVCGSIYGPRIAVLYMRHENPAGSVK